MKVFITGIGVVSPIGDNVVQTMESFNASKAGIGDFEILNSRHRGQLPIAEVRHTDAELGQMAGLQTSLGFSRTALLAVLGARKRLRMPE